MKRFRRKDGDDEPPALGRNGERNFRKGLSRKANQPLERDARLDHRSGWAACMQIRWPGSQAGVYRASGEQERPGGRRLSDASHRHGGASGGTGNVGGAGHKTVGADKAYDTAKFVAESRAIGVTPHVAQNITTHRDSNIDGRTTGHTGYRISQIIRKRIEEANGWIKEVGGMAQTKLHGVERVESSFVLTAAAYNLIRLPRLLATG